MTFKADIEGVVFRELKKYEDDRGWLAELYREDEWISHRPAMSYISMTMPGIIRGPHEHRHQSDLFYFIGQFTVTLWDNRPQSVSYQTKSVIGMTDFAVLVPPGVVHAYQNTGNTPAFVINFPDRLYRGLLRQGLVDEIRHEDDPQTIFKVNS